MHSKDSPERRPLLWFKARLAGEATPSPANQPATQATTIMAHGGDEKTLKAASGQETGPAKVLLSEPMDEFGYVFDIKRTTFS